MHSAGNDYVYLDAVGGPVPPDDVDFSRLAVVLSDRHYGVGGDGLILIERRPSGRLGMRMFNSDGSEGEMCGNGMRCLASYAWREGYVRERRFEVETAAGVIVPEIVAGQDRTCPDILVTVDLGPPREIRALEVTAEDPLLGPAPVSFQGTFVSMGNPHFVVMVPDAAAVDLVRLGPPLEHHPAFPGRANIQFVQVTAPDRLRVRTWERGSGVTLACGTGVSAALVAAVASRAAERKVRAVVDGGELEAEWSDDGSVKVTGLAVEVFRTKWRRPLPRLPRRPGPPD